MAQFIATIEHVIKGPVWGCQMCGQCVLHSTGMTCPMNCPKTLRNGPCGGVRENGHCEVKPEMMCVWNKAYVRTTRWPLPRKWKAEFNFLRPPVDNRLKGGASWVNFFTKRDKWRPSGWNTATEHGHALGEHSAHGHESGAHT